VVFKAAARDARRHDPLAAHPALESRGHQLTRAQSRCAMKWCSTGSIRHSAPSLMRWTTSFVWNGL